jgi:hypothetical protein
MDCRPNPKIVSEVIDDLHRVRLLVYIDNMDHGVRIDNQIMLCGEIRSAPQLAPRILDRSELADRYGGVVDAVHVPRLQADPRRHHAHLLMTTRRVGPDGLGARTALVGDRAPRGAWPLLCSGVVEFVH